MPVYIASKYPHEVLNAKVEKEQGMLNIQKLCIHNLENAKKNVLIDALQNDNQHLLFWEKNRSGTYRIWMSA